MLLLGSLGRGIARGASTLGRYAWRLALAVDQLGNTIAGGNPDETISSRLGKAGRLGRITWYGRLLTRALDRIDKDHALEAIEDDEDTPHAPRSLHDQAPELPADAIPLHFPYYRLASDLPTIGPVRGHWQTRCRFCERPDHLHALDCPWWLWRQSL